MFSNLCKSLAIAIVFALPLSAPSAAAPIKDVLAACDKSASCGYSIDKKGDITGCDTNANGGQGQCFYCANDGKRDCIAVRKVPGGKLKAIKGDALKGITTLQQ